MLGSLVKFVVLSRTSKAGLVLLVSVTAVSLLVSGAFDAFVSNPPATHPQLASRDLQGYYSWTRYSVLYMAFIFTLFGYLVRVVILKSDLDYLFTLPIDRKEISLALLVSNSILFSFLVGYLVVVTLNVYAFLVAPLLGLAMSSLSLATYELSGKYRLPLFALVGLWLASPYFGFPFSPLSVLLGDVIPSLASAAAFAAVSLAAALKSVGNLDLALMKSISEEPERETEPVDLVSASSPSLSVLKMKLSYVGFAGRYALYAQTVSVVARTVSFRRVMTVLVAVGLAYFALLVGIGENADATQLAETLASVYAYTFVLTASGASTITLERMWPTFPALGARYYRLVVLASIVQGLILISPIALAQASFDALFYREGVLPTLVAYYVYVPPALGVGILVFSYLTPMQVREGGMAVNAEIRASNFVSGLLTGLLFIPLAVYIYVPPWVMVALSLILLAVLALSLREEHLYKLVERMTEKGYV
ncbi:MAG: hypothetical protein ACP5HQ_01115 [Thermoprotei archaeon]